MMSGHEATPDSGLSVRQLVDDFLVWSTGHCAPATVKWYAAYLVGSRKAFVSVFGDRLVSDMGPLDLEQWIDRHFSKASENGRLGIKRAVMRCFNWAVKKRLCPTNPLSGADIYSRPGARRLASYQPRRSYLNEEQWKAAIESVASDDWLADLLVLLRETGARPFEIRILEVRHFLPELKVLVIPQDEGKGKKERIIPLTDRAVEIITRLAATRRKHLFVNRRGNPITKHALAKRLGHLSEKLGFRIHAYALRSSFITDGLALGVTSDVLKTVVGHASTRMIQTVYSVLEKRAECLLAASATIRGSNPVRT
ncbi:Tyrosine recombinase XerC [Caulifigura coniformis]|uniref:Tyrosine recombinase XerC n=1 Tax=Caulifigura coniformis TaxID=2527983 RepID=A0A517SCF0_9PLAN|nr:tyrosine-type recombinase/integrase [Caulifigura coniformis]QDT53784.1 Tyrosine recombinase XerC [Caulifigura coniformis]